MIAEIAIAVVSALGGGGVASIVVKRMELGAGERANTLARLERELEAERKRGKECEERHVELIARVRAVEASTPAYLARWVKDRDKRLLWLNDLAYLTMFAPLGHDRAWVAGKTFAELLGEGGGYAAELIDHLDQAALRTPGQVQTVMVQLHPDLPNMIVLKVVVTADDGLLRYEGASFVPSRFGHDIGLLRQHRQNTAAALAVFDDEHDQVIPKYPSTSLGTSGS